ncbi:MAG: DUF6252 family protein [Flavobacterium sp.]
MKKIILLFLSGIALVSCGKDVEFNNPAMQGRINDTFWKATSFSATKSGTGQLTLTGVSAIGTMFLNTSSTAKGTYVLGTTNQINRATFDRNDGSGSTQFITEVTFSSVNKIILNAPGTGYADADLVATTGGSGSGLKVNIKTNASGGVTSVVVNAAGNGYRAGDLITIAGGGNNAKIIVQNVLTSNGEIVITENTGTTISGNFKFTAFNAVSGETIQTRDGIFYKLPIN